MLDTDTVKFVTKGWGFEKWLHNDSRYCGKLLFFSAEKRCSLHYHKLKHETFYLHSGVLECRFFDLTALDDPSFDWHDIPVVIMRPGDVKEIYPGLVHQMMAVGGPAELFEFSTEHFDSDSYRIVVGD